MSLTSYLSNPTFNKEFSQHITFPKKNLPSLDILVPRRCLPTQAALLGTALDYAIRFWLERKYRAIRTRKLVAELALSTKVEMTAKQRKAIQKTVNDALDLITYSKNADSLFAQGCFQLASLDVIVRRGILPENIPFVPTQELIDELRALLQKATQIWPAPERYCLLNPIFGDASMLTSGADADVIQDGCIYDFKCVVKPDIHEPLKQLVGYYVMSTMGGIGSGHNPYKAYPITEVAIYFARHVQLVRFNVADLIDKDGLRNLQELFMTLNSQDDKPEDALYFLKGKHDRDEGFPGPNYSSYYDGSTSDWEEADTAQGRRVEHLLERLVGDEPEDHDAFGFPG